MPYAASPSPKRHMPTDESPSPMLTARSRKRASAASLPPPSVPHLALDSYETWMDGLDVNKPIPRLYPLQRSDTLRKDTESSRRRVEEGSTSGLAGSSSLLKGGGGHIHSSSVSSSTLGDVASRSQFGDSTSNIFSSPSPHRPSGGGGSPSSYFRRGFASQGDASPPSTLRRQGSIRLPAAASGTLLGALSATAAINSDKRSLKSLVKTNKDIRHYLIFLLSIGSSDPRDDLAPVELNLESKANISQLFGALDRNGDGVIYYDDLQVAVPILGLEYFSEVQYRRLLIDGHVIASGGGGGVISKGNTSTRRRPNNNTQQSQPGGDEDDSTAPDQHRSPTSVRKPVGGGGSMHRGSTVRFQEPSNNNTNNTVSHSTSALNQSFLSNGIGIRNLYKILFPQFSLIRIVTILNDMEHPTEKKKTARQQLAPEHIAEIEHLFNFFISQETERNRLKALDASASSPRRQQQQMKPTIAEPAFISPVSDKASPQPLKRRQSALSLQRRGSTLNLTGSGSVGGTTPAAAPLSRFKAAAGKLNQSVRGGSTTTANMNVPTISIEEIVAPVIEPHTTTLLNPTSSKNRTAEEGGPEDGTTTPPRQQQQTHTIAEELKDRAIEHYEQHDIDGDGRLTLDQYIDSMKHNYPPFKAAELHRASLFDLSVSRIPPPNGANPSSGLMSHAASSDPLARKSASPAAHQPSPGGMRGTTASVFKLDRGVAWVDSVVGEGMELVEANHARIVTMYSPRNIVCKFDHLSSSPDFTGVDCGSQSASPKITPRSPHVPPYRNTNNTVPSPPSHRGGSKGARGGTSEADALRPQSFLQPPPPETLSIDIVGNVADPPPHPSPSSNSHSASTTPHGAITNTIPSPPRGGAIELRPIAPYVMLSPQKYGSKMLQTVKSGAIQREWVSNNQVTLSAEQILQEPRSYGEGRVPALMSKYEKSPSP